MKQQVIIFLLLCNFPTGGWAQKEISIEEKQLQAVVVGFFGALAELNVDKAGSFCASDVTILESGEVWTFDSLAVRIKTRKATPVNFSRLNNFHFIETKKLGETAWISYFNEAKITSAGRTVTVKWLESVVLKKLKNEWRISLLHSTELSRIP